MVFSVEKTESEEIQYNLHSSGDGSNAAILPGSRKSKSKGKDKGLKRKEAPALSKSKQRKLRKLEEEKQQKLLQAKSIKLLRKYKISDGACSLLHSSGTIGQVETIKEKRRRAVQFSKAGLEVPEETSIFRKKNDMCTSENLEDMQFDRSVESEPDIFIQNVGGINSMREDGSSIPVLKACGTASFHDSQAKIFVGEEQSTKMKNSDVNIQSEREQPNTGSGRLFETPPVMMPTEKLEGEDRKSGTQKLEVNPPVVVPNRNLERENQKLEHRKSHANAPVVVQVSRPPEIEEKRRDLPIIMMEQEIMEAINENSVVIISGATGCGKTTQVPQFLYEAGFGSSDRPDRRGMIGVTQPRRVAVRSTAERVSLELGFSLRKEVGYQVRHDKVISEGTSIKFMTDGILLRELQSDFLLRRYSVIILDEAHERSLNTDILIGMLSRIIKRRQVSFEEQQLFEEQQKKIRSGVSIPLDERITPLKLILMSATFRVEDFISNKRLFESAPPVIEVPGRQYPVTIHFSKTTHEDYLGQAYKKVLSIHKRLPEGGILVFVTGQREVEYLCEKLRKASRQLGEMRAKRGEGSMRPRGPADADVDGIKEISAAFDMESNVLEYEDDSSYDEGNYFPDMDSDSSGSESDTEIGSDSEEEEDPLTCQAPETDNSKVQDFLIDEDRLSLLKASFDALASKGTNPPTEKTTTNKELKRKEKPDARCHGGLHVLPLYAMLPASAQLKFQNVPQSKRLVVIATNVAETSLTIPGIKYVVDTGKVKVKNYCHVSGVESYDVSWISKASAAQRAGRAGRVGPGHCYRLYSSGAYGKEELFPEFSAPEILKTPVDDTVLLLKSMGINEVENFPFLTSPEKEALTEANKCLKALEAIDSKGSITAIGRAMALYPMSSRHSRMLVTSIDIITSSLHCRHELTLAYSVAAISALSFDNPFLFNFGEKQEDDAKCELDRKRAKESSLKYSNPMSDALSIAFVLHQFELSGNKDGFCKENSLHSKTMGEMSKLREQLLRLVFKHNSKSSCKEEDVKRAWRETQPNKNLLKMEEEEVIAEAICAGWADRVAKRVKFSEIRDLPEEDRKTRAGTVRYQSSALKELVYLNRSSSVSRSAPEFLVYTELVGKKRLYMHGVTSVKPEWLVKHASALCTFSAPLMDPRPFYDPLTDQVFCWKSPSFGPHNWSLPLYHFPIEKTIEKKSLRISVFACALLEGDVLPCLKAAQKYLIGPPSAILRPESLGQTRVGNLLSRMNAGTGTRGVDSRAALREIWRNDSNFLYDEIRNWFQQKYRDNFAGYWAKMQNEVRLPSQELFPKRTKKRSRK